MRFVVALMLLVGALACIGVGVAQRTVWAGPEEISAQVQTEGAAPLAVIDGGVLGANDGRQTVSVEGATPVHAAYGRTADVMAWVGDASYQQIGYDAEQGALTSELVPGTESEVPDILGSDLWLREFTSETDALEFTVNLPDDVSVIVAADGTAAAPGEYAVSWPVESEAPTSAPLIFTGLGLLLAGLAALIWALLHLRRSRGPRRKSPRMPKPPRAPRYYQVRQRAVAGNRGRRTIGRGFVALPVGALVAFGGLFGLAPASAETTPTPTPTPGTPERLPTAVTESQLDTIVQRIGDTVAEADSERNPDLAATRLSGPALAFRQANYTIRGRDDSIAALPAIPTGSVSLALPQQTDAWPRTVLAIVQPPQEGEEQVATFALMLVQADPRSNYTAEYVMTLEPDEQIPDVAAPSVGAARLPETTRLLAVAPTDIAGHYADVLLNGASSQYAAEFNLEGDGLLPQIGIDAKNARRDAIPDTAEITFSDSPGPGQIVALATNESGALVAVSVDETETVRPIEDGATVSTELSVRALSDVATTQTGITATYGNQLLFFVPSVADGGPIELLGYSAALTSASEVE